MTSFINMVYFTVHIHSPSMCGPCHRAAKGCEKPAHCASLIFVAFGLSHSKSKTLSHPELNPHHHQTVLSPVSKILPSQKQKNLERSLNSKHVHWIKINTRFYSSKSMFSLFCLVRLSEFEITEECGGITMNTTTFTSLGPSHPGLPALR